jgi:hypothetical protein
VHCAERYGVDYSVEAVGKVAKRAWADHGEALCSFHVSRIFYLYIL